VSDIDTVGVDGLKVLDPKRPIREADIAGVRRKEDLTSRIGLRKRGPKVHRGRWPPFVSFETETMVQSERLNG
jgi:hypothetical protein